MIKVPLSLIQLLLYDTTAMVGNIVYELGALKCGALVYYKPVQIRLYSSKDFREGSISEVKKTN